jgi:hypothetical protein
LPVFPDTVKVDDSRLQADAQVSAKVVGNGLHARHANVSMGLVSLRPHIGAVDGYDPAGPLCDDFLLNPGLDMSDEMRIPGGKVLSSVIKAEPRIGSPRRRPSSRPAALLEHRQVETEFMDCPGAD